MKKTILLLFLILGLNVFGQTYTATFSFYGDLCDDKAPLSPLNPLADVYNLQINSGTTQLSNTSGATSRTNTGTLTVIPDFPLKNKYELYVDYYCGGGTNMLEYYTNSASFTNNDFNTTIRDGVMNPSSYSGSYVYWIYMTDIIPNNLVINNLSANENCIGSQLSLSAFPYGFPSAVYHWQYSYDNKSWEDVPFFNNNETLNKSIKELFGEELSNTFVDKTIRFRLGYGHDRPFTAPIAINYSRCTPLVTQLDYVKPNCSGEKGSVIMTFDRGLLLPNEELRYVKLLKKGDPQYINNLSTQPILNNFTGNTLIFPNIPSGLANGEYYFTYQAYIGSGNSGIPKGIMDSASKTFTFVKVENLVTSISKIVDTSCYGGNDGSLVLNVKGGTPKSSGLKYNYFVDNHQTNNVIEETDSHNGNTIATISGLNAKPDYKIKVTDEKGCNEAL